MSNQGRWDPNPEMLEVLHLMNFQTGNLARVLRAGGEEIPKKCEAEQAHVLNWLLGLAAEHGPDWKDLVSKRIAEIRDKLAVAEN